VVDPSRQQRKTPPFDGVCSAGDRSRKADIRRIRPTHHRLLHAERVPPQPSKLNRHLSRVRVARFHRRRSGSPGTPPADASSRWGPRLNDCSTSRGALDGDVYARRLPTAALFAHLPLWWFKGHLDTAALLILSALCTHPARRRSRAETCGGKRPCTHLLCAGCGWVGVKSKGRTIG
jgi:hypothetical protein